MRSAPHQPVAVGPHQVDPAGATASRSNASLVISGCDRSCRGLVSPVHSLQFWMLENAMPPQSIWYAVQRMKRIAVWFE
jgi:hypothetical protein